MLPPTSMVSLELVEDHGIRVDPSTNRKPGPPASPPTSAALPMNGGSPRQPHPPSGGDQRQHLLSRASELHNQARHAAEQGDLASAARSILDALDCERRAGGLGPQVLQLIKPR
jgi:hypothetical protein